MIHDLPSKTLSMTGIDYSGQQVTLSNSDLDLSSSSAASPDPKPNRKPGRPVNPLPRHKRVSHINAEHRRRNKIKKGFEALKTLVPAIQESSSLKESKASMLFKAVEHCRQIQAECKAQQEEACALQQELGSLNEDIEKLQAQLPDSGVDQVHPPPANLTDMFDEYITKSVKENWKFLIFSYLIRPLFESYNKMVNTETMRNFKATVHHWQERMLSLSSLRHGSLSAMLQISTKTCIMKDPHKIPMEASEQIANLSLSLNKDDTPPIPTEPVAEKNITCPFSSFSPPTYLPPISTTHAPSSTSTYASNSSSSSLSTTSSFSSSSSISNASTQAYPSPMFLAPDPVDNLMVGASAASTMSNVDLSFLDKYSADYNSAVVKSSSEDCLSTPIWEHMQDFILLNETIMKEKPEGSTSPLTTPTFDLSSFDLSQFTNGYEPFPGLQADV